MRKTHSTILWIITFFIGTFFQYWRGSQIDTLVFATITALLMLTAKNLFEFPNLKGLQFRTSTTVLVICTLIFLIVSFHSALSAIFYLLLIPVILVSMWRGDSLEIETITPAMRRSSWIWFTIGVCTCLAELGNYLAADATHNDRVYPTITVLVDPFVANSAGKIVFITLWSIIGVGLFRVSVKR